MSRFKPNRRQFLERASCLPIGALALRAAAGLNLAYKYVCSTSNSTVEVFARQRNSWTLVQSVSSRLPASSALHPSQPVLYVANRVAEDGGLPRGTVEAYAIDRGNGHLTLTERRPLSLSATEPQSLAVSPDGCHLVVAAFGGGVYNVFSLAPRGELRAITGIFKEVGCGIHPLHQTTSHPHSVVFDAVGHHIISSDFGCDRLNVFAIENSELIRKTCLQVAAGSGPGALTFDSCGSRLSVRNELSGSTSWFSYNNGRIS